MPAGKGRYTVGAKGTHGCNGYPVVGGEGKVHGCHATEAEAQAQQAAIYASQNTEKADFWEGSAFETKSFGYPSANNPLPAKHSGPNTAPSGVVNHPKSTQEIL